MITLDCETDGINTSTSKILELFIYDNDKQISHHYRFNPERPINPAASAVNGITDEDVKDCPLFKDKAKEILKLLKNQTIISYNGIAFDIPLLQSEFKRCGIDWEPKKQIDCLLIWRASEPNKKLSTAYKRYCDKDIKNAHTASADVMATVEIYEKQKELLGSKALEKLSKPEVKEKKVVDLVTLQFGKHKGKSIEGVLKEDRGYVEWLVNNATNMNEELRAHLKTKL